MKALCSLALCIHLFSVGQAIPVTPGVAAAQSAASAKDAVRVAMKNVAYHFSDDIAVHIVSVQGVLVPTRPPQIVVFDDKTSFLLNLDYAEIAMSCDSLAHTLNERVFAAADAPIKNVSIQSNGNTLMVKGKLHQKGNVAFETVGTLSATADARGPLHPDKLKPAHLPAQRPLTF